MRPTYLKFRSPKEETPGFLYPTLTRDGDSLQTKPRHVGCTFSREGRFQHIQQVARRTGFNIGPGCYKYKLSTNRGISARIVKDSVIEAPKSKQFEYQYVGNSIVKVDKPASRAATPNTSFYLNGSYCSNDKVIANSTNGQRELQIGASRRSSSQGRRPFDSRNELSGYQNSSLWRPIPVFEPLNRSREEKSFSQENKSKTSQLPQIIGETKPKAVGEKNNEIREDPKGEN